MSDRGPTYLNVIDFAPESKPAILAVLAEHFDGRIDSEAVLIGSQNTIMLGANGTVTVEDYLDNQDNYGNAESLLAELIAAGATRVNFTLHLSDGIYTFRSRGSEKRVDVANDEGEFYVTERQLDAWLREPDISIESLTEKLREHFGSDWP